MNNHDKSIDYMKIRTRNNSDPHGKPKVYFTCHPHDFDTYFDMICNDIFKTQDCAIYYTEDMNKPIPEVYKDTDLGSMNLFVVPITWKLLYEPNRAMESDLAFAMEHNYPILPLMMESGIEEFYTQKFGKKQYLNPYSHDITEISYEVKLKKYLATVLLDDKTIKRIQAAFDAYIFLSYRKKDRHLANELMRLIHNNPKYRDIAIWYDEYLLPGENFETIIRQALNKSDLFTLLVTPNLVNEDNYIRNVEYPEARKAKKHILAAEMVKTDKDKLKEQYEDIPSQVDAHNQDELNSSLIDALKAIAIQTNDTDPEHNYLIGLAYLEGIDVEVNISRGIELITSSAEASYLDAMETLYDIYSDGYKVSINYQEALKWAQRLTDYYSKNYGEEDEQTLVWLNNLGVAYHRLGSKEDCEKGLELLTKCYHIYCQKLGEKHPDTLSLLNNLALSYSGLGNYQKAIELNTKCYDLRCEVLGKKHPDTLVTLNNLAYSYDSIKDVQNTLKYSNECYDLYCEVFGKKHYYSLIALNNLASAYSDLCYYQKALELYHESYALQCNLLGKKHPSTLTILNNLAETYRKIRDYDTSLKMHTECYEIYCEVLGETHPSSIGSLNNLAQVYNDIEDYQKALELNIKCYNLRREVLGEKHPSTLYTLNNLGTCYSKLGNHTEAINLLISCHQLQCEVLGEKNYIALITLSNLGYAYSRFGDYEQAINISINCYNLFKETLGEEHPDTLQTLDNIACFYYRQGQYDISIKLFASCYESSVKILGEKNPSVILLVNNLALNYAKLGEYIKALEMFYKNYPILCEVYGEDYRNTQLTLTNIANIYREYSRYLYEKKDYDKTRKLNIMHYNFLCSKPTKDYKEIKRTILFIMADSSRLKDRKTLNEFVQLLNECEKKIRNSRNQ